MVPPKPFETWPEYLKRVVPKGNRCGSGSCQYHKNSRCQIWDTEITDNIKCGWCVGCIRHPEDQE